MGTESSGADAIGIIELELMKLVRHLETLGRRSSLYERVDRAGYLAMRMLDGLGPVSTNTLARALRLDASTVTRQLTVLECHGFVQRCANPADGRSSTIVLTPEGRQCMCDVQRERWQHIGELVSGWTEREQCDLGTALTRLNVSLAGSVARLGRSAAHDPAASAQARSSAWENTSADCAPDTP
jgi:DNA-binding MarR family transcriptional regulator